MGGLGRDYFGRAGTILVRVVPPLMALLAFATAATGFLLLFASLPVGLLWRSRRYLADATAVELTRNPTGLYRGLRHLGEAGAVIPGGELGRAPLHRGSGRRAGSALMGARVPEVVAQLTARQRKLADVRTRLHRLAEGPGARSAEEVVPEIRRRLADMQGLAHREPAYVRQILRKFLVGRYLLTPEITPSGRFYEIRGQASYGRLLTNLLSVKGVVPRGDSNTRPRV